MEKVISITTPVTTSQVQELRAGDNVLITGNIYTGRDAAHKRLIELLADGKELPIDLNGQFIYYVGPSPAKPGHVVGSAGPTTSYRMEPYTPTLLKLGLKGMIGKGALSKEVVEAMKENGAVYFGAVGGAAALISKAIKKAEVVCYEDLGAEAIHKFYVEKFPVTVVIDSKGNNLYETEPQKYKLP
ncbi:MAG TPA: Fe-S-containing hydro-lyase [Firmicutes bacterium]|jgi:fumarate hydratase subunit beta|nr:Fe-S-containing hydro-lyase [Bacillota bacterium]